MKAPGARTAAWISSIRFHTLLMGFVSLLFFLFVVFRAFSVPFTHDESFSYLDLAEPFSLKEIVCEPQYSAGNHLLNTVLLKIIPLVLPLDDWTLRLPNLLAYALFLYAGFRVCRHLFTAPLRVVVFVLLNLNMFLLQFFSLARGYGLALGFMMASLWFFLESMGSDAHRPSWYAASLGAAVIACFANLSCLIFYCALIFVGTVIRLRGWKRIKPFPRFLPPNLARILMFWDVLLTFYILTKTLIPFAFNIRRVDGFYYGGGRGFLEDTVFSLVKYYLSVDAVKERLAPFVGMGIGLLLVILFLFYAAVPLIARQDSRTGKAAALYWIMFVSAMATVIQHHALGTLYLIDRTAVLFVPLFVLSVAGLFAWEGNRFRIWMRYKTILLFTALLGFSAWQFARAANVTFTLAWMFDSKTTDMLSDLQAARLADGKSGSIRLGATMALVPSIRFYAKIQGCSWLEWVNREGIENGTFDYYYILDQDRNYAKSRKAAIVKYYPLSETWLMRVPSQ